MDGSSSSPPVALITGGGHGLGAEIALGFARAGVRVRLCGRDATRLNATVDRIRSQGHEAESSRCDLADRQAIETLNLEDVTILVNNAGVASSAAIDRTPFEMWERCLAINTTAPFLLARRSWDRMRARGSGTIINIASIAGLEGAPYLAAYVASKHALVGLTRVLAAEGKRHGITAHAICPGFISGELTESAIAAQMQRAGIDRTAALQAVLASAGQSHLLEPEEIVDACLDCARLPARASADLPATIVELCPRA